MGILEIITALSHQYGTSDYVKAGGGNTSCKDATTLWVKPSGTTLAGLKPETFVALDRAVLARLYDATPPTEPAAREELVKQMMVAAVKPETPGRASVEAPLHDSISARYVVHTHPAAVNGMTCAVGGAKVAARLFPEALWVPYVDPGYTLCRVVRKEMAGYKRCYGVEPTVIFLENHGVFVAGECEEDIHDSYARIMQVLVNAYKVAGVWTEGPMSVTPATVQMKWQQVLRDALGTDATAVTGADLFNVGHGPISPDHIVYAKSFAFEGILTVENLQAFKTVRGYAPRVVVTDGAVLGIGVNEKVARLALELAHDGAMVQHLARAFGGVRYLNDGARDFIENWEVESFRSKQI